MQRRFGPLVEQLRQGLWPIPAIGVAAAVLAHVVFLEVDERLSEGTARWFVFGGGAESARSVLETMATSMLSMTTLVFSITMLVLQLASSQLSPRVLSTFLRDRQNQVVLGLFVSTYAYVLLTLREIRQDFVPGVSVWTAFVAVMLSVGAFVYYIHHVAQSIRVVSVIRRVAKETEQALERLYPAGIGEPAPEPDAIELPAGPADTVYRWPSKSGVVVSIDAEALERQCRDFGGVVRIELTVGDFIGRGSRFGSAWGARAPREEEIAELVVVGHQRTLQQDALYGFRQLVDIAVRALSPGVNDPTTAAQVLDSLHGLLLDLAGRSIPPPVRTDDEGRPFLILSRPDWDAYVALSVDEIRREGRDSIQIVRRLRYLLEDLLDRVPAERAGIVRQELAELSLETEQEFSGYDRRVARLPGRQGHGQIE